MRSSKTNETLRIVEKQKYCVPKKSRSPRARTESWPQKTDARKHAQNVFCTVIVRTSRVLRCSSASRRTQQRRTPFEQRGGARVRGRDDRADARDRAPGSVSAALSGRAGPPAPPGGQSAAVAGGHAGSGDGWPLSAKSSVPAARSPPAGGGVVGVVGGRGRAHDGLEQHVRRVGAARERRLGRVEAEERRGRGGVAVVHDHAAGPEQQQVREERKRRGRRLVDRRRVCAAPQRAARPASRATTAARLRRGEADVGSSSSSTDGRPTSASPDREPAPLAAAQVADPHARALAEPERAHRRVRAAAALAASPPSLSAAANSSVSWTLSASRKTSSCMT